MLTPHNTHIGFRFPNVHEAADCLVWARRKSSVRDGDQPGSSYLDRAPIQSVDDYAGRLPDSWVTPGGRVIPIRPDEDLTLTVRYREPCGFPTGGSRYPVALKIAAGKMNAISGGPWTEELLESPAQDYVVIPTDATVDGLCVGPEVFRSLPVAFADGFSPEAETGGIRIVLYPLKASLYQPCHDMACMMSTLRIPPPGETATVAAGHYLNKHGYDVEAWDQSARVGCHIHLIDAAHARPAPEPSADAPGISSHTSAAHGPISDPRTGRSLS